MNDDETRVRARLREYADAVEPIADVPAEGRARYRRHVRRRRAAAVLAGVLVVVGASGLGVELSRRPSHQAQFGTRGGSSSPSASVTTIAPSVLAKLSVTDATWISAETGWVLTPSLILRTTNGGLTWVSLEHPPVAVGASFTHIRFADSHHGYLFGDSFFTTDDGGSTWTHHSSPPVVAFEVAHGRAYRLVSVGDGCPGPCDYTLETSTVGTVAWTRVDTPKIGPGTGAQLLYDGPRLYIATYGSAMNPTLHLLRSVNGGASWQQSPNPCAEDLPVQLATAPNGFVVALCRHNAGGTYIRTSSDEGSTFGAARSLPPTFSTPGYGGVAIATGAPGTIVVVGTDGRIAHVVVSHDVGASWAETLTISGFTTDDAVSFLGFEDAQTGRVAIGDDRIWTTRDGGETWTANRA